MAITSLIPLTVMSPVSLPEMTTSDRPICLLLARSYEWNVTANVPLPEMGRSASLTVLNQSLSKGAKLTVVVSQRYGDVCAFWTDERVFISLDDCNKRSSKNKMYLYVLDASLFIVAVFVEGLCTFDTFRQLYISISAQRRKSIRKRARRTLRDNSKENTKRTK